MPGYDGTGRQGADYYRNTDIQIVAITNSAATTAQLTTTSSTKAAITSIPLSSYPTKKPTSWPTTTECYYVFTNQAFDLKPEETSWDVTRQVGGFNSAVISSEPYTPGMMDYFKKLYLSVGDYVFTIMIQDSGEDGMGEGSYSVTTNNREVIAQGGSFGSSESTAFPLPTLK